MVTVFIGFGSCVLIPVSLSACSLLLLYHKRKGLASRGGGFFGGFVRELFPNFGYFFMIPTIGSLRTAGFLVK